LAFWVIKICATTLGETGGDAVTMSMGLGYLLGSVLFGSIFLLAVAVQIRAGEFHPLLYWTTIVATTTVGTTLADLADRSLGIGYPGGASLLLVLTLGSLLLWRVRLGTISIHSVTSPKQESYYWTVIMFSQTLGTALGDWTADSEGLGYAGGVLAFGLLLAAAAACYVWTTISRTALFWTAFILTRPLGSVVGDFLDKPLDQGGLALSRYAASALLTVAIVACLLLFPQRAATATTAAPGKDRAT